MDWLRIGAFALLIFYHIGMVFVPWGYHVKTAEPIAWATIPMFVTNAWRLALLFVVSGYASRALFAKAPRPAVFASNRSKRLLVPLLFGIAVIVPPQSWVELVTQHGYPHGFWHFWTRDYFRFGTLAGVALPGWNHLWFVAYLWAYTLALALILSLRRGGATLQRGFEAAFGGWRLLVVPIGWFILVRVLLFPGIPETQNFYFDPVGHLMYLPCFLFGFLLAGSPGLVRRAGALWKPAAVLAVLGYAAVAGVELAWLGPPEPPAWAYALFRTGRSIECWAAIVALIGIADRFWNHDHPARPMLTEAVFPFYIIHQTIIVVAGWWLLRFALPPLPEFAILAAVTVAGCWLFYLIGRRIEPLRPLIGLRRRVARAPGSATTAPVI